MELDSLENEMMSCVLVNAWWEKLTKPSVISQYFCFRNFKVPAPIPSIITYTDTKVTLLFPGVHPPLY